jgi:signal transduction histidine kinase
VAALAPVIGVVLSGGFAALVSIYSVAARRPMRIALLATVVHICLAAPYYFIFPVFDASFTTWVAFMLLLYLPALSLGLAARSRRQVIAGLVAAAERDRRSYEMRLDRARQIERSRIAREMHDVLAHRISLLSVHAGALEYRTRDGAGPLDAAELRAAVGVIRSSAHQALEDLTEVLDLLRPTTSNHTADDELSAGRPQPTIADVPRLAAEAEAAGQRVRLRLEVDAGELDRFRPQAQRTVFRVVQEGLTNARKHAPGAAVDVRVGRQPDGAVTVAVVNALPVGTTGSEIPGAGAGLTGLAERVEVEGGRLGTVVADGQFALSAEIPWRP